MVTREETRKRMQRDSVQYLLVQFVDLNGSPKVKMVPAAQLDNVIDAGAAFAGVALPGIGQGPHSHDMMARIDLGSYTPVPWTEGIARFASDLFVDGQPHMYCPRQNLKRVLAHVRQEGYAFNVGIEPEHYLVTKAQDGSIAVWDPHGQDDLRYPCYDFKGTAGAIDYLRNMMDAMGKMGWGPYQSDHEDGNGQYEIHSHSPTVLAAAAIYTTTWRTPTTGRTCFSTNGTHEVWDYPDWPIISSEASSPTRRRCAPSCRPR